MFTPVMRTHEGNRPETNFQYYDDEDAMEQLARLVDIYTMLAPYTKALVKRILSPVFLCSALFLSTMRRMKKPMISSISTFRTGYAGGAGIPGRCP